MKTLKKYFKQILCFIAFMALAFLFAFNPSTTGFNEAVFAAGQYFEKMFSSTNMQSKVDLLSENAAENEFRIPVLNLDTSSARSAVKDYIIRVYDPNRNVYECKITDGKIVSATSPFETDAKTASTEGKITTAGSFSQEDEKNYITFNSLNEGSYNVVYIVEESGKYYFSEEHKVDVSYVEYEFDSSNLLLRKSSAVGDQITLPAVDLKIKGTDAVVKNPDISVSVIFEGKPLTVGDVFKKGENGTYTLTPDKTGKYTVVYSYMGGNTHPTIQRDIFVKENFEKPTELTIRNISPISCELGQKGVTLPNITVDDNVDSDVDFKITSIEIIKYNTGNDVIKQVLENTRTFDMTLDKFYKNETLGGVANYSELAGDYKVVYHVVDAYGTIAEKSFNMSNVKDNTAPDVYMAYSYDLSDGAEEAGAKPIQWTIKEGRVFTTDSNGEESDKVAPKTKTENETKVDDVNTDFAVDFKKYYGYSELYFPAIYAKDNVTNYNKFIFVRSFRSVSNPNLNYYIDNLKVDNDGNITVVKSGEDGFNYALQEYGEENTAVNFNKVTKFKFSAEDTDTDKFAGEYRLYYSVFPLNDDGTVNTNQRKYLYTSSSSSERYTFTVSKQSTISADATDQYSEKPTVSIQKINKSIIGKNDSIEVLLDSYDGEDRTTVVDTKLKNYVFYYSTDAAKNNDTLKADIIKALNQILYNQDTAQNSIQENYFSTFNSNILDREAFKTEMGKLNYTNFTALTTSDSLNFKAKVELTDVKKLQVVAITLNDNMNIAVDSKVVSVKDTTETDIPYVDSATAKVVTADDLKQKMNLQEGEELASTIKFMALDGNTKVSVGETIYLPSINFKDDTDTQLDRNVQYYVLDAKVSETNLPKVNFESPDRSYGFYSIKVNKAGTYYVVYSAIDDAGNLAYKVYTFEAVSATTPKLDVFVTLNEQELSSDQNQFNFDAIVGDTVSFSVRLTDRDTFEDLTFDEKATLPAPEYSGPACEESEDNTNHEYSYTFNKIGTYTFTFSGSYDFSDKSGLESDTRSATPKTITINVKAPAVVWNYDGEFKTTAQVGEDVYLPFISATQGGKSVEVEVSFDKDGLQPVSGLKLVEQEVPMFGSDGEPIMDVDGETPRTTKVRYYTFKTNTKEDQTESGNLYKGTYKILYKTVNSPYGDSQIYTGKAIEIKVGDTTDPILQFKNSTAESDLTKDIVYDGTNRIEYIIEKNTTVANKGLRITVKNGDNEYTIDTKLEVLDKDDEQTDYQVQYSWSELQVYLEDNSNITKGTEEDYKTPYYISGPGEYTLVVTYKDGYDNYVTERYVFHVISETKTEKHISDTVLGVVLIVVSLVILAGVILFFTFTGKKGSGKGKNTKTPSKKLVAETAPETDTDVKSGDVE